jgi:hypothetical protein
MQVSRRQALAWLERHAPELAIVALGCALRIASLRWLTVYDGYDFHAHFEHIKWYLTHWQLAPPDLSRESFQPPLYYFVAGKLLRLGLEPWYLGVPSVVLGCVRLPIVWLGLERVLPERRAARLAALALAAVLPASVHLDGMASNEMLLEFLGTLALVMVPWAFAGGARRAALVGLVLGLALLTKISALALAASVFAGAALLPRARWRGWALAALVSVTLSGWYYAHNRIHYGKALLTSFDGKDRYQSARIAGIPYWQRRKPGFFFAWSLSIYREPYYPAGLEPPRYFPVLIATTFVDYYNYFFAKPPPEKDPTALDEVGRPIRPAVFTFSRLSVLGGTLIAAATAAAWCACAFAWRRRRDPAELVLLIAPLIGLLAAIHFAVQYPFDDLGHIKGTFLQWTAAPLCGLFGVAFGWLWERRRARPVAVALLCALAFVACYSACARFF